MSMDKYTRIRRYRNVLKLREEGMSFDAIGKRYGRSRQRIWQLYEDAVKWRDSPKPKRGRPRLSEEGGQLDRVAGQADGEKVPRKRWVGFGRFRLDRT